MHISIRDVPRILVQKAIHKAKRGDPPVSFRWVMIALLERWVNGVDVTADTPLPDEPITREQSF